MKSTAESWTATSVHFSWSYGQAEFRRLDFSHSVKHLGVIVEFVAMAAKLPLLYREWKSIIICDVHDMFVHLKILRSLPQKEISVSSIPCDTLSARFSKKITQLKCNFDHGTKILFSNVCNIGHVLSVQFIIYSNLLCWLKVSVCVSLSIYYIVQP